MASGFVDTNDYRERYRVLVVKKLFFRENQTRYNNPSIISY